MASPVERGDDEFIHRPELDGEIEFRDVVLPSRAG